MDSQTVIAVCDFLLVVIAFIGIIELCLMRKDG